MNDVTGEDDLMDWLMSGTTTAVLAYGAGHVLWRRRPARQTRLAAERALVAAHRGIEHRRLRVHKAADIAITTAVPDPGDGMRLVTVARVQQLAVEHFGLQVETEEAAMALAGRLHHRGWLGIQTDLREG